MHAAFEYVQSFAFLLIFVTILNRSDSASFFFPKKIYDRLSRAYSQGVNAILYPAMKYGASLGSIHESIDSFL